MVFKITVNRYSVVGNRVDFSVITTGNTSNSKV